MDRRQFLTTVGVAGTTGVAGCSTGEHSRTRIQFRLGENGFERRRGGSFVPFSVRGVNLGMAKPGAFPGQAAITREEYDRWLAAIGEMNANAIRTYTIHPPAFYDALAAYNQQASEPLFLFQGTWIGEAQLLEAGDVTTLTDAFDRELRRTVDVVHGETTVPARAGHASGEFTTDVSPYLLGYITGIEWPPSVVIETNDHAESGSYDGQYIQTTTASPFERWLAGGLDTVAAHSDQTYGTQRPVAFTNWVTTDPLTHPYEPFEYEDAVSVDPDSLTTTAQFDAGLFAAYHIYPYYPDFLNHTPEYTEYTDHRGEPNSYAGYLNDLVSVTDHPLLVAEFGVPTSRGIAHKHVHGRDQGRHTEQEQGRIVAAMYEDIIAEETAGGLIFTWQDEWFKRTWNLHSFSEPSRRPYWSNVQTPEQQFGLLTFDPAGKINLDGTDSDWASATRFEPTDDPYRLDDGADSQRTLTGLSVTHDAAFLSLRLEFDSLSDPVGWSQMNAVIAIGHTGRGNTRLPFGTEAAVSPTDFIVHLAGPDRSRLRVDAYYDAFAREHGGPAGLSLNEYQTRDSGRFQPSRMVINRGYTVPPTGERVPFEAVETGKLRFGNGNPNADAYDSLADVFVDPTSDVIEIRLPWLLLNVADPSSRLALANIWEGDVAQFESFNSISLAAGTYKPRSDATAQPIPGATNLTHALPSVADGSLTTGEYSWETWTEPNYEERRKESYWIIQELFAES